MNEVIRLANPTASNTEALALLRRLGELPAASHQHLTTLLDILAASPSGRLVIGEALGELSDLVYLTDPVCMGLLGELEQALMDEDALCSARLSLAVWVRVRRVLLGTLLPPEIQVADQYEAELDRRQALLDQLALNLLDFYAQAV